MNNEELTIDLLAKIGGGYGGVLVNGGSPSRGIIHPNSKRQRSNKGVLAAAFGLLNEPLFGYKRVHLGPQK